MKKRLVLVPALVLLLVSATDAEPPFFVVEPAQPSQGDIVRVSISLPPSVREGTVTLAGRTFKGFATGGGLTAYAGIDLDTKPGKTILSWTMGSQTGERELTVKAKKFATESLKVNSAYTDLDEATLVRVRREQEVLKRLWKTSTEERLWRKSFVKPADGPPGSPFGLRRFFNGEPRSPHAGLDIKAHAGSEVFATNSGKVVLSADLFFTGNTVIIDHGLGLYTIYAHLSRSYVGNQDSVDRSQLIGRVGATGRVTGPHLHWGVKLGGARVDPAMLPGLLL
mgnify:CR=1 FL=1